MEPARLLLHPLAGPLKGVRWKAAEIAARSHSISPPLSKLHSLASILLSLAPSTPTFFSSFSASHTLPTPHTHSLILTHIRIQTRPGCCPPACRLWLSWWNQDAGPPPWFLLTPALSTHLHPGSGLSPLRHQLAWCQSDTAESQLPCSPPQLSRRLERGSKNGSSSHPHPGSSERALYKHSILPQHAEQGFLLPEPSPQPACSHPTQPRQGDSFRHFLKNHLQLSELLGQGESCWCYTMPIKLPSIPSPPSKSGAITEGERLLCLAWLASPRPFWTT